MSGFVVEMPYIGGVSSKNDYKWGRGTKKTVKVWMKQLAEKVEGYKGFSRYEVHVSGQFKDERRPDLQNLFEVVSDALQEGLGVNDKWFEFHDAGYRLGHEEEKLFIRLVGKEA